MENIVQILYDEFLNQSLYFENDSKAIRSKRIQTIFQYLYAIIFSNLFFTFARTFIFFIEPSSTISTILTIFFMTGLLFIMIGLYNFKAKNLVPSDEEFKFKRKILLQFENIIGFYANLISLFMIIFLPFVIFFENKNFDQGIQFMMAFTCLEFIQIILMQPTKLIQLRAIIFSSIYFILCCFSGFTFVNLFFIGGALTFRLSVNYFSDKISKSNGKLIEKKQKLLKMNNELFKLIDDPLLIINQKVTEIHFKNKAFDQMSSLIENSDGLKALKLLKDENQNSVYDLCLNNMKKDYNSFSSSNKQEEKCRKDSNILSFQPQSISNQNNFFHIKMIKKKLKTFGGEVIALYFHDVGNEIEKRVLEKNIELSNLMLYSLSHEVRTPLNGMQGILQLLTNKLEKKLDHQIKVAISCSEFLTSQINCILDYSQIIKNQFKIHLESVEINKYFNHIQNICQDNLINKYDKVNFVLIFQSSKEFIIFDPQRIQQIICNLINNATKYTCKGEIVLKFQFNESQDIEISIIDTGCGLFPDQVNILNNYESNLKFKNFYQKIGFPGYKLSICQILLKEMNSKLVVSSQKELGSCFSFKLNFSKLKEYEDILYLKGTKSKSFIEDEMTNINYCDKYKVNFVIHSFRELDSNKKPVKTKSALLKVRKKWIFVIDDVALNRFVITGMIQNCGFSFILEGSNGKQALEYAQEKNRNEEKFLIFLDIDMPIMNGIECTKLIRQFSSEPIIAVTSFIGEEVRTKALSSGMNEFLTKPITIMQIKSILQKYKYI